MQEKKIIIVGAGVVGLSSAYYLAKAGHQVTILDSGDGKSNCSTGNAGYLCPSHVVPLSAPGIITQGLKWMLNNKSPFYVQPRLNKDLIQWAWLFKKNATKAHVQHAAPILNEITIQSQKLTEQLISVEKLDVGYKKSGLIMMCQSKEELGHEVEAAKLAHSFGQKYEVLSTEETEKLNPELEADIAGSVYFPGDSMLTPNRYVAALREKVEALGVSIINNTEVTDIVTEKGSIKSIGSSDSHFEADEYIIAAGSWSPSLVKSLGINLPMQGGKGYSFMLKQDEIPVMPEVPAILTEGKVAMTPMMHGLRFAGTMEINELNHKISPNRIEGIIGTVQRFLPQFKTEHFEKIEPWAGYRPCSPDGLPYIGRAGQYSNLIVASGHAMLGLTLGAYTGAMVQDIVNKMVPDHTLDFMSVNRFA